jgi:hypothetical protein
MPSVAAILRKSCQANRLGTSGSSKTLLSRLLGAASIAKKSKKTKTSKVNVKSKSVQAHLKRQKSNNASKRTPCKSTKNGGCRWSASSYFYDTCDGKISRCRPQCIRQSNGTYRLKEIKIVMGANGPHPRWVLVK